MDPFKDITLLLPAEHTRQVWNIERRQTWCIAVHASLQAVSGTSSSHATAAILGRGWRWPTDDYRSAEGKEAADCLFIVGWHGTEVSVRLVLVLQIWQYCYCSCQYHWNDQRMCRSNRLLQGYTRAGMNRDVAGCMNRKVNWRYLPVCLTD